MSNNKESTVTAATLIEGLKEVVDYKQGKIKLECVEVAVPPLDVRGIREKLELTQEEFSEKYKIPLSTFRNWEQGHRTPHGPARVLLLLIQARPEEIAQVLLEMGEE